ncbi:tetratricopeptide repeat protein [Micromonospora sp. KC207]|uniref:tetratricopeptide repeat protein n=1 Tax=Micromonospora sp. KC207 TaxID=2530377 RepID=UPI001050DB97|nr:tetratricopeptide repeat protein [Micromonospora sp. KC207]TDC64067.1 tetratricopeptide repeat protein [Micromonospora sp. KC207]
MGSHHWIAANRRADHDRLRGRLELPPLLARIDAHRRLRGPYTAAGQLVRAIGTDALARCPELGPRHHIEILTAAPEFDGAVPHIRATLEHRPTSEARTRYQARLHTLRIAHGLTEFIRDYLAALDGAPRTVVFANMQEADPTDREFVAVLLRRLDAARLTVVVETGTDAMLEPPGPVSVSLPATLRERTIHHTALAGGATTGQEGNATREEGETPGDGDTEADRAILAGLDDAAIHELAHAHVATECLDDDPTGLAAYRSISAADRAALHDERKAVLVSRTEPSLLLGAVPFHAERGTGSPAEIAGILRAAQVYCKNRGLYHATVELGMRGRAVLDLADAPDLWWDLTGDVTTSLAATSRAQEAEALYDEARTISIDPAIHMHAAYGTSMLFARHYDDERRDPERARRWLNQAIAIASLLPDPKERAFQSAFQRNGLALVETRQGRPETALQLLNEGMALLDRELEPEEQMLHRTGLRYNRAQVYGMFGRLEEALADYNFVIDADPNFPDHYFNRGNVLRRLGRNAEAIEDYQQTLLLSPPFPEAYYNLADARLELDDAEGALADLDRVLELDSEHVSAWVNRAGLRCDLDDLDGAWADVTAGLAVAPDNAHLLCLRGRVLAERGETDAAHQALTAALGVDAGLAEAWALRGGLRYGSGDLTTAITDFDRALELLDTPEIRYNRALVHQAAGRFAEAAGDYRAVLAVADDADAADRLDACLAAMSTPATV